MVREIRRGFPARKGLKASAGRSNRMVLNSAAARLGQSLRETQDVLVRDELESSASIINCVGKDSADVKSSLIDLELLAA